MALIKWTPLDSLMDFERPFESFLSSMQPFVPALDMYEKDNDVIVEIALVDIDPEQVKVSIEDNVLSIEGSHEHKKEVDDANYYRKEVRSGSFHRVVTLPSAVNEAAVKAAYEKGLLRITLPKKEEIRSKSIKIDITKK